jgi:WD40 repeat protein
LAALLLLAAGLVPWLPADDSPPAGLVATLKGHTEAVYAIAFTPDGKYVVTGSGDRSLKVWETAGAKEFKTFAGPAGHQNLVLSVSISPDGSLIASGSSDNTARVWDFPRTSPLRDIAKSEGATALAVSPDGTKLAGGGKDGGVRIWNIADGKELLNLAGHAGPVTGVAFSPNGQLLVSSGSDRTLRFWDPAKGQAVAAFGAHAGSAASVVFHPNANLAASAGADGVLKYWNLPPVPPRSLAAPHADAVACMALSADGGTVVSGGADKVVRLSSLANGQAVRNLEGAQAAVQSVAAGGPLVAAGTADRRLLVWQAQDGKLMANVPAHGGAGATSLAFNPAAPQLATAGGDGLLKLWTLPPVPEQALTHPDSVLAAAAFADGKRLVTGGADKVVRTWNLAAPQQPERQFSGHAAAVRAVAIGPGGQALASAGDDETIRFWNPANGQQTAILGAHAGPVVGLAYHPSGQVLSASADGSLKLWQAPAAAAKLFAHPGEVTSAVLSPDGARLLTGCGDRQVRLWNLASGQVERPFAGPALGVLAVAFNPAGTQIAAGSADKTVRVWDAANVKEIKAFPLPAAVHSVAFTPDAKMVAAGLADGGIRLLDLMTGKEAKTLAGHTGIVHALGFTPKGDLVSASADKTVRVWSVADGKPKASLTHDAAVQGLALSKDGAKVAAGGADKVVKVWSLADGKPVATLTTPAVVHGIAFSPEGNRLLVGGADGRARAYDLEGRLLEFFAHDGPVLAAAWHADGKRVFTAGADKTARPWSLSLLWQGQHPGGVRQAVFARNDRVVSCGADKTVKVWQLADGKLVRTIAAHDGPVAGVAVTADGARIASTGDKTVKVWTLAGPADGKEEKPQIIDIPAAAEALAFSPDGKRIAASIPGMKGALHVYDAAAAKELLALDGHAAPVHALEFLADNRTLLSAGEDKAVRLADVNVTAALDAHPGGVAAIAFNPAGTLLLTGGADKTVKVWDPAKGQVTKTFGPLAEAVRAVAFNRAGTHVAAAAGKEVRVWTLADGKEVRSLTHPAEVVGVAFSLDGSRVATACGDQQAHVWELATGQELVAFPHAGPVRAVACPPSSNDLVLAANDKTVTVHTITVTKVIPTGAPVRRLTALPSGTHFVTADEAGKVKQWTPAGATDRTYPEGTKPVHALAASKNNLLLATGGADQVVRLYTLADGKLILSLKAPASVLQLAFTPDSQALMAACEGGALQAWNVVFQPGQPTPAEFGKVVQTYQAAGATDFAFAPAGGQFFTAGADPVKVWKLAAEAPVKNFAHPNLVDSVAFSPDGTQLATGCHDGRVRIFDVAKGAVLKDLAAHVMPMPSSVYCVAWSPDGKRVVSSSYDHSLKIWDVAGGKMLIECKAHQDKVFEKGHTGAVYFAAFSPDGKFLASGGDDKAIKIWNTADGSVVRELAHPAIKPPPVPGGGPPPPQAHPGYIYGVRFTPDGRYLLSAGGAPQNKGFLAVWNAADGKLLSGDELAVGTLFALTLSADGKLVGLGTGGTVRAGGPEVNNGLILKLPPAAK